jgi:hypothetical protein
MLTHEERRDSREDVPIRLADVADEPNQRTARQRIVLRVRLLAAEREVGFLRRSAKDRREIR